MEHEGGIPGEPCEPYLLRVPRLQAVDDVYMAEGLKPVSLENLDGFELWHPRCILAAKWWGRGCSKFRVYFPLEYIR